MRALVLSLVVVALAGCSVPALVLDGKHCPCATGYVCEPASNTCVTSLLDGGPIDSAIDQAIDAPDMSCFGTAHGALLYGTDFADFAGWTTMGGLWATNGGELLQADPSVTLSYAYRAGTWPNDYRIVSTMRMTTGADGNAIGLAARVQVPTNDGQYHCNWGPTDGVLAIMYTSTDGVGTGNYKTTTIDLPVIPGYQPTDPVTMEFQIVGDHAQCCLREFPGSPLSTFGTTSFPDGIPAVRTTRMAAAYADFRVYAMP